jgi:putative peptide zinc metalloprotease protein
MHVQTAWQFLPNLRFDGYYILADLVGVPDLFGFIRPAVLSLLPGRPTHPLVRQLKPRARRVILTWVALVVPTLLAWLVVFLLAAPELLPAAWRASLEYVHHLDAAARAGDVVSTLLGVSQLFLLALPWMGIALVVWSTAALIARRPVVRWAVALGPERRAALRRRAALTALTGLGGLLVLRTVQVAGSHPAGGGELRLVDSAVAALHGTAGPPVGAGEWLMRAQLMVYAELTGAFERHDSIVTAGREPAVVASVVLVAALLALTLRRRVRPLVAALPLGALLAMGPAVTVLATSASGVVGAAWAVAGALLVVAARRSALVVSGLALVVVGVATAPSVVVPLAVGIGVLRSAGRHSRCEATRPRHAAGPRHAHRAGRWEVWLRWLAAPAVLSVVVLSVAVLSVVLSRGTGTASLDPAERTILLLLVVLVVAAALPVRRLRRAAAAVAGLALVAVLPWAGAGQVLAVALLAGALLGALLVVAWTSGPVQQRPHPLVRIAVALPVLVLVVAGALFLPSAGRVPPHGQLAAWIDGPGSTGGTVAVPAGLWGDLVRDGVQPGRLVRDPGDTQQQTDWVVTVGGDTEGTPATVVTFGAGPAALTVRPGVAGQEGGSAAGDESA